MVNPSFTVALLSPGDMGSSLLSCLANSSHPPQKMFCNLSERSERTKKLSAPLIEQGVLVDVGTDEGLLQADIILSVLVNDQAITVGKKLAELSKKLEDKKQRYFVDLNALAPATAIEIGSYFEDSPFAFVDGGIIGGPAREDYIPYLPISGPRAQEVKDILQGFGDSIEVVGDKVGQASAMKMSYASLTKGMIGIQVNALILASKFNILDGFAKCLSRGNPSALKSIENMLPVNMAKAFRWIGEMEEISKSYGDIGLKGGEEIFQGEADVYRFVEQNEVLGKEKVEEARAKKRHWTEVVEILEKGLPQ